MISKNTELKFKNTMGKDWNGKWLEIIAKWTIRQFNGELLTFDNKMICLCTICNNVMFAIGALHAHYTNASFLK